MNGYTQKVNPVVIDNFYAALYTRGVANGTINPPGEVSYKGYCRKLFCSINGNSIEDIHFDKAQENSVDSVTHLVVMTGKGKVIYSNLLTHNK